MTANPTSKKLNVCHLPQSPYTAENWSPGSSEAPDSFLLEADGSRRLSSSLHCSDMFEVEFITGKAIESNWAPRQKLYLNSLQLQCSEVTVKCQMRREADSSMTPICRSDLLCMIFSMIHFSRVESMCHQDVRHTHQDHASVVWQLERYLSPRYQAHTSTASICLAARKMS